MKLWKWLIGDRWIVKRCGWPYPDGYCTFNKKKNTILDTGLTQEQAQHLCDELNAR